MSNKTKNLARNLLAIMAMGASMGSIPGVNAAEKPAQAESKKEKSNESSKKSAPAAPAAKGGVPAVALPVTGVAGAAIGFGVGKFLLGGSSGYINPNTKQVDNYVTGLINVARGVVTDKISEENRKNLDKADLAQIAYAIANSCVLTKHSGDVNSAIVADDGINLIINGKIAGNINARENDKVYKNATTAETLAQEITPDGLIIDFSNGATWRSYLDTNTIANDPVKAAQGDIVRALDIKCHSLLGCLEVSKAKITVKKESVVVVVGGKTITLSDFKTANFKDSKMKIE